MNRLECVLKAVLDPFKDKMKYCIEALGPFKK